MSREDPMYTFKTPIQRDVEELEACTAQASVSLYLKSVNHSVQNPNRTIFKNDIKQVIKSLDSMSIDDEISQEILTQLQSLYEDDMFWNSIHSGLALFISPGFLRGFFMPNDEGVHDLKVQGVFHVEPLRKYVMSNKEYLVLSLGHKHSTLYSGDRYGLRKLRVAGMPANMLDSVQLDEYPQSRETHTIAPAVMGKGSEAYHSQYDVSKTDKMILEKYFRHINQVLSEYLRDSTKPLLLASVRYLWPMYKKTNTYPYLLKQGLAGNFEEIPAGDLHTLAWKRVRSLK